LNSLDLEIEELRAKKISLSTLSFEDDDDFGIAVFRDVLDMSAAASASSNSSFMDEPNFSINCSAIDQPDQFEFEVRIQDLFKSIQAQSKTIKETL
jgi:hypothetical protein